MELTPSDTPTITVTPGGVAGAFNDAGTARLAPISTGDLQGFDRAIRHYAGSRNGLINASADLLAVCGTLSRLKPGEDLNTTRTELSRSIIDLKYKIVRLDYPPSVAENLCLLFAIALDEFILVSPWGSESGWENRTLVADLFGFRDGGDRFYNVTDRALMQPRALREFLEIVYIFLKLGYRGKYDRGNDDARHRLTDRIETALALDQVPAAVQAPGREVRSSRAPVRTMTTRAKLALSVGAIVTIVVGMWGLRLQVEQGLRREFEDRRAAAESESAVDFVFSSQSGETTTRPRQ